MKMSKNGICQHCLDYTILYKLENLWFCYRCRLNRRHSKSREMMSDNKVDNKVDNNLDNPF